MSRDPRCPASTILAIAGLLAAAPAQQPGKEGAEDKKSPVSSVTWHQGALSDSLATASATGLPVVVYFWMDGSSHCSNLWGNTLTTPAAEAELSNFVCHGADATTEAGSALVQRYGVSTLPTLLVVGPDGAADDAMIGFVPLPTFVSEMQRIRNGSGTVTNLRNTAAAAPKNLDLRFQLGQKLHFVGNKQEGDAIFDSIRRDDPEGATAPGAELMLFDVRNEIVDKAPDKNDPATWNLAPMYKRLKKTRQPVVLWKGWNWLAQVEIQRGEPERQVAAWRAAAPHAPEPGFDEWCGEVLMQLWERRDAIKSKGRALARDLSKGIVKRDAKKDDANPPPHAKVRSFVLSAAACGYSIAGKRSKALALIKRAKALTPESRDLDQLEQQIRR